MPTQETPRRVACLLFALAPIAFALSASSPARAESFAPATKTAEAPLRFEANAGAFDASVAFAARGPGYSLFLSRAGAILDLARSEDTSVSAHAGAEGRVVGTQRLMLRLRGAREIMPRGEEVLPGRIRYCTAGRSPACGNESRAFGRVVYDGVLPGVSAVYYGTAAGELEYDFVLEPFVEPASIVLSLEGAVGVDITSDGDALVRLPDGRELRKRAPIAYQPEPNGARRSVGVRYERRGPLELGFAVEAHDRSRPLVIDPVLLYSTYLGGSSLDGAEAVALDASGNSYVVGYTFSSNFPTRAPLQGFRGGNYDAFVSKFGPGGELVHSTYLGGSGDDRAWDVAVDAAGNAYVAGETTSTNFPVVGAVQGANGGGQDAFVSKLNSTGSALSFSTYLGGSGIDTASSLALAPSGHVHVAGSTDSTNFPVVAAFRATLAGGSDAFVSELPATGASLLHSTYLGGTQDDRAEGIAVGAQGAVVVGYTASGDFPMKSAFQGIPGGGGDAFVSQIATSGATLVHSSYLGGDAVDWGHAVALDGRGNAFVVGFTGSPDFPAFDGVGSTYHGGLEGFVTEVAVGGNAIVRSSFLGGSGDEEAHGVAVDAAGNVAVSGQTTSLNFPVLRAVQIGNAGGTDAFATLIAANGTEFLYSSYLGGSDTDSANDVALDARGAAVVGVTASSNLNTRTELQPGLRGLRDGFILYLATNPPAVPFGTTRTQGILAVALLSLGVWAGRGRFSRKSAS